MEVYPNPQQKHEDEVLLDLGTSLEEILKDETRFVKPDERKAVLLLSRIQVLLEDETLHADQWHSIVEESKYFTAKFFREQLSGFFKDSGLVSTMKKVFDLSIPDSLGEYKKIAFDLLEGKKEVTFPSYTFENERQYYQKLYGIRVGLLQMLYFPIAKQQHDSEQGE